MPRKTSSFFDNDFDDLTLDQADNMPKASSSSGTKGQPILNCALAEADTNAPSIVKSALIKAINRNMSHYADPRGYSEFLSAISTYFSRARHAQIDPNTEILSTVGSGEAIYLALCGILPKPGLEAIIPDPSYHGFEPRVKYLKGKVIFTRLGGPLEDPHIDIDSLNSLIHKNKTKAILICNPNNPTGIVCSEKEIKNIVSLAKDHGIVVLFDENYAELVYDNKNFFSAASLFQNYKENIVIISGLSKTFGMSGFRLGYVIGSKRLISHLKKIGFEIHGAVCTHDQIAGSAALNHSNEITSSLRRIYEPRRTLALKLLREKAGLECEDVESGLTAFPSIPKAFKEDSDRFCTDLLRRCHVFVNYGREFGIHGEGHFRFCFGISEERMRIAIDRMMKMYTS
jgi:aminotransferase